MSKMGKIGLQDIRIAALVSDGFEEAELNDLVDDLQALGAVVEIVAQNTDQMHTGVQAMNGLKMAGLVRPHAPIQDVSPDRYQGLLIPGGALSVDRMRESRLHIAFVQGFMDAEKPVAILGHGGWLLADAGFAQGRTLTSWPTIQKDLERAGAIWKMQDAIVDRNLVTSRGAVELPIFSEAFAELLAQFYGRGEKAAA